MEFILAPIIGFIDYLVTFNICEAFTTQKVSDIKKYGIAVVAAIIINTILTLLNSSVNVPEFIITSVLSTIILTFIYNGNAVILFFSAIGTYVVSLLCESLVMVLIIYLLDTTFETIIYSVPLWLIFAGTSRFLMYVTTFIFGKWWRKERSLNFISKSEWIQILMFGIISYSSTIIIVVYYFNSGEQEIYLALFSICIFVANIIVLNITSQFSDKRRVEQDNIMLKQQVKLGMDNVEALMETYAQQRKITHDFNNYIEVLKTLMANNQIEDAMRYLKEMDTNRFKMSNIIKTNNAVIDALLNYKYSVANRNNILTEVNISDLSNIPISDEDMIALLANILDNAIEAASKSNEKRIKIKISNDSNELFILVRNTVSNAVTIEDKSIETTKSNKLEHGFGLKIINTITDKYDGMLKIDCDDKWFTTSVLIYK